MKIAIVTDSTGDFPEGYLDQHDIPWVPNYIIFGDDMYADRINLEPEEFYELTRTRSEFPSTSQPTPADFKKIYDRLADEGYEHILSIHISDGISGVCSSAHFAAKESRIPVTVVDSKTTTRQLAFAVDNAIKAREAGASVEEIVAVVGETVADSRVLLMLDTLENLIRGGRAGRVQGLAASLLNIKVIVTLEDGLVVPWKKAKGRKKAFEEIAKEVANQAEVKGPLECILLEADSKGEVEKLREAIENTGADVTITGVNSIGPTVTVHSATGCVGVVFRPMPQA